MKMLVRLSLTKHLVAVIILGYLSLAESATVRGRLRNFSLNTKCLRPIGQDNGAKLEVVDCSDSTTDQIIEANGFKNLESEAGYIQFDLGGKCLSLDGFSADNGVNLLIWDCVGQDNQRWSIVNGNSEGTFQLQLKQTGKCLTAEDGGAYVDQWDCVGTEAAPHQSWTLDVMSVSNDNPNVPPPIDTSTVRGRLRNLAFNTKCLHATGGDNGAELEVIDCSDSSTLLKMDSFQDMEHVPGYIQFDFTSKCLSLNGFSGDNGVRVLIWDCVNQDNQKWSIVNGDSGSSFQLQLKETGKCLTAEGGGTYIDQWDCIGTEAAPHQSWTLDVVVDIAPKLDEGVYKVLLRNFALNTKCLHATGGDNGAALEVVDCSETNSDQLLKMDGFANIENEAAYIQFDVSGKCLSLNGFSADNGVHTSIWDCVNQDNQKWKVINGDLGGSFQLQLKETGKCLTAEGGGTYLDQWDCLGTEAAPHQSWTIDKIQMDSFGEDINPYPFYQLENFNSPNNCLRYKDGSDSSYALELAPCDSEDPSQRIVAFTDFIDQLGFSGIQFLNTAKCLDVAGESNSNGASVGQWNCVNQANQKWRMEKIDLTAGTFRIRTELGDRCLTSEGSGSYMDIWDCYDKSDAPHQYWKQRNPNKESGSSSGANKLQLLQNFKFPDKCLHPVGTSKENGAELELIDCDSIKPEESMNTNEWLNYDTAPGYVRFNGKCLSMSGFDSDNGVRLVQWDCVDQANQRWQIVNGNIDSSFQLKSEQSSKCLTAEGDGSYMDQWDCLGSDAAPHQSWMIKTFGGGGVLHDVESSDDLGEPEHFFEPEGALLEMVDYPGKCLSVSGVTGENEVILADCNQFDDNQLFDHTDLLNYNTHPGLLKLLGTGKCLSVSSDGHVKQVDCDISNLEEMWHVVIGTLFGTFKLKSSQSPKCITAEDSGSYTDVTDCAVVSDSRRKRDLNSRSLLRLSYKMSQPNNNQLYLIRSAYFSGYCLTRSGADNWDQSDVGIEACNKEDERQQWHFETVGQSFQNKFFVRNSARCLWSKGNGNGKPVDYQDNCVEKDEYIFIFRSYGTQNAYYQLQNAASGLCAQIKWYQDSTTGKYVDYIEQQPCGLVGWSAWMSIPITDPSLDYKCGPNNGGKFCTGKYAGNCCSKYGSCGTTSAYCARLNCDANHGPCITAVTKNSNLDDRCGPWVATFANRRGTCQGRYAAAGYCCSNYGVCGNQPEHCLADNCDAEYGQCPVYDENKYPNKCGPLWGNKMCSGANTGQCCSKYSKLSGQCGTKDLHCGPANCDPLYGSCPGVEECMWIGNSKKLCRAGECCSSSGKCGTSEAFCGKNCNALLSCGSCRGGLTTTAGGLMPDKFGTCRTTTCSAEGEPCTIRGWCCDGLKCVADSANSTPTYKAKKCVKN